jgi:pyruvate/2-oxoglutarate dehydrogenase complex dihydrolipoamide acyltransferase (E2) component
MEGFEVLHYPRSRVATFDVGRIGMRKHHVAGLLEVDVSLARAKVREAIKAGRELSFTAWVIKTIADTIAKDSFIHAINHGRGSQVAFKDVDISMPIEKVVDGVPVPLATVIRKANEKSIEEIAAGIRAAVGLEVRTDKDFVLEGGGSQPLAGLFFSMPAFLRRALWSFLLSSPFRRKRAMGTVMVTNVGMAGRFPGWILPKSLHNLCFGIGSIVKKPWVRRDRIEIRDILNLTVLFDHDVVDGGPAARFTDKLVRNLEGALGL